MRDVTSEYIEFKNDCSFYGLVDELWSGAKERWQEADEETRIAVWDRVKDWVDAVSYDGHIPTMTQICLSLLTIPFLPLCTLRHFSLLRISLSLR